MAAIRRRDPDVLARVARAHLPILLRAARAACAQGASAHDAAQDALLVFVQRAGDFDGRAPVGHWLLGILYRTLKTQRRALAREEPHSQAADPFEARFDADGMWIEPPGPENFAAGSQAMTCVWAAASCARAVTA